MKEIVPDVLRRKVFLWALFSAFMALTSLGFWVLHLSCEVVVTGFVFSGILAVISASILKTIKRGEYVTLSGTIKERGRGLFGRNLWILVQSGEEIHRVYIREGKSLCLPGTPVEVYIRRGTRPRIVEGVRTYYEYLAISFGVKKK